MESSYTSLKWRTRRSLSRAFGLHELHTTSQRSTFLRDLCVEAGGTFTLLATVCFLTASPNPPTVHHGAMAVGLVVACIIWVSASTSGGFINPAITTSAVAIGVLKPVRGACYIIAQLTGSYAAVAFVLAVTPKAAVMPDQFALTVLCNGLHPVQGVLIEVFVTFLLTITVWATLDKQRSDLKGSGPLTVGLAVACAGMFAIPYTGCSMNPARSFGPALASNNWINHWVYWVGPMVGSLFAGIVYKYTIQLSSEDNIDLSIADIYKGELEKKQMTFVPSSERAMTLPKLPPIHNVIMVPAVRKTSLPYL